MHKVLLRNVAAVLLAAITLICATAADAKRSTKEADPAEQLRLEKAEKKAIDDCFVMTRGIEKAARAELEAHKRSTDSDAVERYLFDVYLRTNKYDSTGCFAWKDPKSAARIGMTLKQYVIGGLHPVFKQRLYDMAQRLESEGFTVGMLSGFRDDYRQGLIKAGIRASMRNSWHGGSNRTQGWGDGHAADIVALAVDVSFDEESLEAYKQDAARRWNLNRKMRSRIDETVATSKLHRPMGDGDPAHVQPTGDIGVSQTVVNRQRLGIKIAEVSSTQTPEEAAKLDDIVEELRQKREKEIASVPESQKTADADTPKKTSVGSITKKPEVKHVKKKKKKKKIRRRRRDDDDDD